MKTLVIDTSQEIGYILFFKEELLIKKKTFSTKSSAKTLLPLIAEIEETADLIAVSCGPGSFTGTRIGVITAKMLGYAQGIPIVTYHSLMPYPEGAYLIGHQNNGYTLQANGEISLRPIDTIDGPLATEKNFDPGKIIQFALKEHHEGRVKPLNEIEVSYLQPL